MKRITIVTCKYKNELAAFARMVSKNGLCTVVSNHAGSIKFCWESSATADFACALLRLMQNIAMLENPVYRHSPKLQGLAENLQTACEAERLCAYIKGSKQLHLEGYVIFRMDEYRAKLDNMLYTIVKKINLNK